MRKLRYFISTLLAVALLYGAAAHADCTLPAPPSHIPDGNSANEQEMAAAMRTLKQYNDDVDEYGKCLDFERRRNVISATDLEEHHNDAINTLAMVVARFNQQVKIFKSRRS